MSAVDIAVGVYRKLEPEDFQILRAIEIQMKRYEYVPEDVIHKPANLPPQEVAYRLPTLRKKASSDAGEEPTQVTVSQQQDTTP